MSSRREKPIPPAKPPETTKPISLEGLAKDGVDVPQPGKGPRTPFLSEPRRRSEGRLTLVLLGGKTVAKGNAKFDLQKDDDRQRRLVGPDDGEWQGRREDRPGSGWNKAS